MQGTAHDAACPRIDGLAPAERAAAQPGSLPQPFTLCAPRCRCTSLACKPGAHKSLLSCSEARVTYPTAEEAEIVCRSLDVDREVRALTFCFLLSKVDS